MNREIHVRFWESVEVRFLCATHHLAEVQYRFNRRFDLSVILVRLVRACIVTTPRPARRIRLAEECH
jgi:hypothetical protein